MVHLYGTLPYSTSKLGKESPTVNLINLIVFINILLYVYHGEYESNSQRVNIRKTISFPPGNKAKSAIVVSTIPSEYKLTRSLP